MCRGVGLYFIQNFNPEYLAHGIFCNLYFVVKLLVTEQIEGIASTFYNTKIENVRNNSVVELQQDINSADMLKNLPPS